MPNKPLVSIIIPFYNRIDWVIEAINSVINQTYDNWEIILIDDGSDSENKIPSEILYNNKIILLAQENMGPSSARNKGIKNAKGKYIAFLDSDDLFCPEKLERQIKFMDDNQEIHLSYTSYKYIDEEGNSQKIIKSVIKSTNTYPKIIFNCLIATPTVMVKKELFQNGYLFDESIRIGEDTILWSDISKSYKLAGIDEPLTYVRKHGQSNAFDKKSKFIGLNNIFDYFLKKETDNNYIRSKLLLGKGLNMYRNKLYKKSFSLILQSFLKNPWGNIELLIFLISKKLNSKQF